MQQWKNYTSKNNHIFVHASAVSSSILTLCFQVFQRSLYSVYKLSLPCLVFLHRYVELRILNSENQHWCSAFFVFHCCWQFLSSSSFHFPYGLFQVLIVIYKDLFSFNNYLELLNHMYIKLSNKINNLFSDFLSWDIYNIITILYLHFFFGQNLNFLINIPHVKKC